MKMKEIRPNKIERVERLTVIFISKYGRQTVDYKNVDRRYRKDCLQVALREDFSVFEYFLFKQIIEITEKGSNGWQSVRVEKLGEEENEQNNV